MNKKIGIEIKNNIDQVCKNSLLNCHVKGMHSIVISNNNGLLRRIFITDKDHEMWMNDFDNGFKNELSLAIHPHHVNIDITPIKGNIYNILFSKKSSGKNIVSTVDINKYKRTSKILNGKGGFEYIGSDLIGFIGKELLTNNKLKCQSCLMDGQELHTVYVPKGEETSWLVTETGSNENYDNINYSNGDLEKWESNGYYQKPTMDQLLEILKIAGIDL